MWLSGKALYTRIEALEQQLESERERNRAREEVLINRILSRAGAFPIMDDELTKTDAPLPPQPEPAGLADVREQFMGWAAEDGASDMEARQQWELHKESYSEALR